MSKNKMIAVGIVLLMFFGPFILGYISFDHESGIIQALMMMVTIIGVLLGIWMFNKDVPGEHH